MRVQTINAEQSKGRILWQTVLHHGGKKLFRKGHMITEKDVSTLADEGMAEIAVTELEADEVGEDEAVMEMAEVTACGSFVTRLVAGGRANLHAAEACCVLVDDDLLKQINGATGIAVATCLNFSYARSGQKIATIKSTPIAVAKAQLEAVISIARERGPLLQARPIRAPHVGVLYTDPVNGGKARQLFENTMRQRLERLGTAATYALASVEEESALAISLQHILRSRPTLILIASTTAPAGPNDVVGRAMLRVGCAIERFLAPVDPGNLMLLGYKDDIPLVSAPGCFHSARANVVDLILPPMLAQYRISAWEIGCLGHGGVLTQ